MKTSSYVFYAQLVINCSQTYKRFHLWIRCSNQFHCLRNIELEIPTIIAFFFCNLGFYQYFDLCSFLNKSGVQIFYILCYYMCETNESFLSGLFVKFILPEFFSSVSFDFTSNLFRLRACLQSDKVSKIS